MPKPFLLSLAVATLFGCAREPATTGASPSTTERAATPAAGSDAPEAELPRAPRRVVEDPALAAHLAAEHLGGVVALLEPDADVIRCSDAEACAERSPPASTFKIVNAIVALDAGVAPDETLAIPWDGVRRDIEAWNRDHTLRSAYDVSCLPYFQELACRVGLARFREALPRFGYGDAETGDVVDRFWLAGPLEISPVEQIAFLERFERGELPIAERTRTIMREVMIRERRGDGEGEAVLRGKTGWAAPDSPDERGWFVGYATRGGRSTYVAIRATRDRGVPDATFMTGRMAAAIRALASVGAY